MMRLKHCFTISLVLLGLILAPMPLYAESHQGPGGAMTKEATGLSEPNQTPGYPLMPGPGKKVHLGDSGYFIYSFDKKPKLGTVIMKVEVFNSGDTKDISVEMSADAGMPSMKGAHETGDRAFTLSKKGAYLLPVNIVMPGGWEIRLTIKKAGKVIFRGSHQFDV